MKKGFTLLELLIVIAIIAILAVVVFVALDPLTRFRDARNAQRWSDVTAILDAIKLQQVDNGGSYFGALADSGIVAGTEYAILNADVTTGVTSCDDCAAVAATTDCLAFEEGTDDPIVMGYLPDSPMAPTSSDTSGIAWADHADDLTGYYMIKNTNGTVTVGSCEPDDAANNTITVSR